MKRIKKKIRLKKEPYIVYDPKTDIRVLSEICNLLIDTVNELIEEVEQLKNEREAAKCAK